MDLNCDLGEDPAQLERDLRLLELVTSVNIACGGHAGDEHTMRTMAAAALERGVRIGAHPSYPDREGFGRRDIAMDPHDLERTVALQVANLGRIVRELGGELSHVKPHGALYHACARDEEIARTVANASLAWTPAIALVCPAGPPGDKCDETWRSMGARVLREAFADRRYEPDGSLRSRVKADALIEEPQAAAEQARRIALGEDLRAADGRHISLEAQTICIHADTPGAVRIAQAVASTVRS